MENDFPAAHSMDTCFFAVDRDGHVAIFDTGEAGAVPNQACSGSAAYELRERLRAIAPRTEVIYSLEGRVCPGRGDAEGERHLPDSTDSWAIIMFLSSTQPVQHLIDQGQCRVVPSTEENCVIFDAGCPSSLFHQLHDERICKGCFHWWGRFDEQEGRLPPAASGIYEYSHLTENWIAGPYGCDQVPAVPLHVDQLPPRFREQVKMMKFEDLCFGETPHIQPVEHVPCVSWGTSYLDITGKEARPLPGMEDAFDGDENDQMDIF